MPPSFTMRLTRFSPPLLRCWLSILLGLMLTGLVLPALAMQHQFEVALPGAHIKGQIHYLVDDSHQRQLADILSPAGQAAFSDPGHEVRARYDHRPYWLKISMTHSGTAGDWLFALPTTAIQDVQFFGPYDATGQALAEPVHTGLAHPYSSRPLGSERYVFRVRLPDPGHYTAYLRLVSETSQLYEVTAWDPATYLESRQGKRLFDGLTYGILLTLLIHNLMLFIAFRDATYGFYVLNCGFALLTVASFNGHAARYLFPNWPPGIELAYVIAPSLWILSSSLFARHFLDLPRNAPWLNGLNRVPIGLSILAITLGLAAQVTPAQRLNEVISISGILFFLMTGAIILAGGFRPARWYLAGQSMLFLAVSAIVLVNWGYINSPFMLSHGLQLGIVMEMLVFALALSGRIRLMRTRQLALQDKAGQLAQAAQTDPLTGLANRAGLDTRAQVLLKQPLAHSLMLLDLDHFKPVNDEFGHNAGDQVLKTVAQRMRALVREPDTVARLGGDEFVVLVAATADHATLIALAQRLQAAIREPVPFQGGCAQIDSSLGIATCPQHGQSLVDLMACADRAMYQAKQAGRGRFAFYAPQQPTN